MQNAKCIMQNYGLKHFVFSSLNLCLLRNFLKKVSKTSKTLMLKQFRSIFVQDKAQVKKQNDGLLSVSRVAFLRSNAVLRKKTKKLLDVLYLLSNLLNLTLCLNDKSGYFKFLAFRADSVDFAVYFLGKKVEFSSCGSV